MTFRDRIIERRRMRVGDLAANPFNPRLHPDIQRERLAAILEQYGIIDGVIAYYSERNGGDLTLFDGHARRGIDPAQEWEVGITDLTDAEVDELVMMFDPIAAMAETDRQTMATLLDSANVVDPVLTEMLAAEAEATGLYFNPDEVEFPEYDEGIADEVEMTTCPNCGHEFPK